MSDLVPTEPGGEFLLYRTGDGQVRLEVRLQDETLWLTQQMMAELFHTTVPNISMHIKNVLEEGELAPEGTVQKFLTVRRRAFKEAEGETETIKQLEAAAKDLQQLQETKDPSDQEGSK